MNSVANLLKKPFSSHSTEEQLLIRRLGRPVPDLSIVQKVVCQNRQFTRSFNKDIYNKFDWLCGCDVNNALFCFPCLLFDQDEIWTKIGMSDVNHLAGRIKLHETCTNHMRSVFQFAIFGNINVQKQLDTKHRENVALHNENVKKNRYLLNDIINSVRSCSVFEIVFKEHEENVDSNRINFNEELHLKLKSIYKKSKVFRTAFKSIQNDILQIMLEECQQKISEEIKRTDYLAIIADDISDVAKPYQTAIIYRYVINEKPVERFWSFLTIPRESATTLASCILDELERHNINANKHKLIGVSVMGESSYGVQAIVKEEYPNAAYVHYYDHQMSSIMMKAVSLNVNIQVFFSDLQGVCSFFINKPDGIHTLNKVARKRKRISLPTTIRWNFHTGGVGTVYEYKEDIIETLKIILNNNEKQKNDIVSHASALIETLTNGNFSFWLFFFNQLMPHVDMLFNETQKKDMDPALATKLIVNFEETVTKIKESLDRVGALLAISTKIENLETLKKEAKETCDLIICQAKDRLSSKGHQVAASLFLSEKFTHYKTVFPENNLKMTSAAYPFLDKVKLRKELSIIYSIPEFGKMCGAVGLLEILRETKLETIFSEVVKLLKVLITIPMGTTEPERRLSTVKRIKTFLNNVVIDNNLTALAMLSIEQDLLVNIPHLNQSIMDKFGDREHWSKDFSFRSNKAGVDDDSDDVPPEPEEEEEDSGDESEEGRMETSSEEDPIGIVPKKKARVDKEKNGDRLDVCMERYLTAKWAENKESCPEMDYLRGILPDIKRMNPSQQYRFRMATHQNIGEILYSSYE